MKKTILVFATTLAAIGAYAQTDTSHHKISPPDIDNINGSRVNDSINTHPKMNAPSKNYDQPLVETTMKDGLMMKNGRMMVIKNGRMTIMDKDITLTNGDRVTSNGNIISKDGAKATLYEGQHIDMSGKIIPMKK